MKKILVLFIYIFVAVMPVSAATIKVKALSDFNTENPTDTLTVEAVTDLNLDNEIMIFEGYKMKGDIVDVVSPKRLKRDASFSFVLKEYTDLNGEVHKLNQENQTVKGKFTTKFDYLSAAKSAALTVGSYFVKGLSLGYAAVEGAIKNEEDNRFKSSAMSVYESSPISYVEKGEDIFIAKDQVFILNFKLKDEEVTEPNYEYTEIENPKKEENNENPSENLQNTNSSSSEKSFVDVNATEVKDSKELENLNTQTAPPEQTEAVDTNNEVKDLEDLDTNVPAKSVVKEDSSAVEYEEYDGFHLRRRTRKYPMEMENQTVPDTAQPMSVPDPQNTQPLAPIELPDTY